jgi:hypothetical protein
VIEICTVVRANQDPRTVFEYQRLQTQIDLCLSVAESHGVSTDDIHIYKDEGLSGSAKSAPNLDKLLSKIAEYGSIYVPSLTRISRDGIRAAEAINLILSSATTIWCCDTGEQITNLQKPSLIAKRD